MNIRGTFMDNLLDTTKEKLSKEDYEKIPVAYCRNCLSLNIMKIDDDDPELDYCDECGSTSILVTNIDKWRELYKEKYGKHLI